MQINTRITSTNDCLQLAKNVGTGLMVLRPSLAILSSLLKITYQAIFLIVLRFT